MVVRVIYVPGAFGSNAIPDQIYAVGRTRKKAGLFMDDLLPFPIDRAEGLAKLFPICENQQDAHHLSLLGTVNRFNAQMPVSLYPSGGGRLMQWTEVG